MWLGAVQLGAAPDFEPRVAASQVRYHFACGSKPVSLERYAAAARQLSPLPRAAPEQRTVEQSRGVYASSRRDH